MAERALALGLEVLKSANVNEEGDRNRIVDASRESGWASICAFGQLIREPLLTDAPMFNVHPSLLPRWRGAAPIERAIMSGDSETGVCIMRLEAGLDSGPVAMVEKTAIAPEEDFGSLSTRLAEIGGSLLVEALARASAGEISWTPQDDDRATYAEKIEADERVIDLGQSARACHDRIRALTPHVGAWLPLEGGDRLGVVGSRVVDVPGPGPGRASGEDGRLLVGCADGPLELVAVKPAGRTEMDARSYLAGYGPPVPGTP